MLSKLQTLEQNKNNNNNLIFLKGEFWKCVQNKNLQILCHIFFFIFVILFHSLHFLLYCFIFKHFFYLFNFFHILSYIFYFSYTYKHIMSLCHITIIMLFYLWTLVLFLMLDIDPELKLEEEHSPVLGPQRIIKVNTMIFKMILNWIQFHLWNPKVYFIRFVLTFLWLPVLSWH